MSINSSKGAKNATFNGATLDSFSTISAKIRYLNNCGLNRASIARTLGIRYQWVRNVLITNVATPKEAVPNK